VPYRIVVPGSAKGAQK
jgi:hypothetical protein